MNPASSLGLYGNTGPFCYGNIQQQNRKYYVSLIAVLPVAAVS
jgi:hypothetical protein